MQPLNENQTPEDDNASHRFSDKRTDDRIRQHLTNEKDNISADDINNVQSNVASAEDNTTSDDEDIIDNTKEGKYIGKDDDDKDKPKDITPWNVIE
jgi:hypothetical protein